MEIRKTQAGIFVYIVDMYMFKIQKKKKKKKKKRRRRRGRRKKKYLSVFKDYRENETRALYVHP